MLKRFRHGTPFSEVINIVAGGPLLLAPTTVDISEAVRPTKAQALSVPFVTVCIIIDHVGLSLIVHLCANNLQLSVCVACAFNISRSACCMGISLGVQRDIVDFACGSVAQSISIKRQLSK